MNEYRLLDGCCCEGGAGKGYMMAGFNVTGVDKEKRFHKRYPATFIHGDAIAFIYDYGHRFDAIHISPPCQKETRGNIMNDTSNYPDLIDAARQACISTGRPYVIENVEQAWRNGKIRKDLMLCGSMFGLTAMDTDGIKLGLERHRIFESNVPLVAPKPDYHDPALWVAGAYGGARRDKYEAKYIRKGGYVPSIPVLRELLGIDWMTQGGMFEALPPVYTEWIGRQLIAAL